MARIYRVSVLLPHTSLLPRDQDVMNFIFESNATSLTTTEATHVSTAIDDFFNTGNGSGNPTIAECIDAAVTRVSGACPIEITDITAHLDGSAAGPPTQVTQFTLAGAHSGAGLAPAETAAVLTLHGSGRAAAAVLGPSSTIPTDHRAQQEGAPSTHTGRTHPKQSHTGRIYVGPLNSFALGRDSASEVRLSATFTVALATAANRMMTSLLLLSPTMAWVVWSRKLASTDHVIGGHVDNAPDTQRRRGVAATSRTTF